jgi:hypothetical protein
VGWKETQSCLEIEGENQTMMLKRIYEDSSLTSLFAVINEEISFKGIAIRITGTAGATAPVVGDVGRIQYFKKGVAIVDAGFDTLLAFGDLIGGTPNRESTNSGVVDLFAYIPRRYLDKNVEHVVPSDNAQIKCTFNANLATRIASAGKVEVYLDIERGVQNYDLVMRQYSDSVSGASVRPMAIDQPNIFFVGSSATVSAVLTLTGSNITQYAVEIGGVQGDCTVGAAQDNTTFQFNIENLVGTASLVPYELMAALYVGDGDITSKLYDNVRVLITTSGASSPELLIASALFDNDRLNASAGKQKARVIDITQRKNQRGDSATVTALANIAAINATS